ncbi:MAG: hypothetical protein MUP40_00925 [Actinobacteria bacterium]|nr:hypothetical protein [Actinomycetota bacterium]
METREDFDGPVLTGQLVEIIENDSDKIAETWYREVKDSSYTPSVGGISEEDALKMATDVYRKLGYWLMRTHGHEVKETYHRFGEQLYWKHFRMEEVVMTLVLIKRYLWLHLLEGGLMTTRLELYQALELNNKVVLYFDRAIYFAIIGYKEARAKDMADQAS